MGAPPEAGARLLVVDDDEGLLLLMAETLRAEGHQVAAARSAREARVLVQRQAPDLMVLDLKLPDAGGPGLASEFRTAGVPFMVVTGQGDEKVAVEVMKQGALDYVMKDTALLDLLPAVVRRALGAVRQGRALADAQAEHRRLEREILAAGERERHSIGADLHDGLGQQLTALELMCTACKEEAAADPGLSRQLDLMGRMLREAIAQTRFLARGLVPVGGEPDALQNGLTELAHRTGALGRLACRFECPEPVLVADPFVSGHLYRIAQEAVNNAVKHSGARQVRVRLADEAGHVVLDVSDNGRGLPKAGSGWEGVGFGVMRHRAAVIGAGLAVGARRPRGVTISCRWPRPKPVPSP